MLSIVATSRPIAPYGIVDVEFVRTAEAAIDHARSASLDLIVVDVLPPVETKLEICRHLRSTGSGARVPTIVTSARLSEADRVLALDLGADDCVTRPFGSQEFAARARAVTRRHF